MSTQNIKTVFFVGAIILFNQAALTAQIEKGVTSLGGNATFENTKFNSSAATSNFNSLNVSPSYGRFITDRIMVKGRLNTLLANSTIDNTSIYSGNYDYKSNNKQLSLEAETRYYFNPAAKWKFFGGISLGGTFGNSVYNVFQNNTLLSKTDKIFSGFDYSIFGGVNRFLNNEIALEATIGYSSTNSGFPLGVGYFGKTPNVGLNISLNNFINFKSTEKDFEGLISEGRTIIGGNLSLNAYSYKNINPDTRTNGSYAKLDLEYGRFVATGLLIGAKTNIILEKNYQSYAITPYAQYFYPVSKRLMLHAKAEIQASINQNNTTYLTFKGGIGATYFLSKNVALSADLLNFSTTTIKSKPFGNEGQYKNFTPSIGLRFFLK